MTDPWDEQWRVEAAHGVVVPGSIVRTGGTWRAYARMRPGANDDDAVRFEVGVFMVMARLQDPTGDDEDGRVGWDDVLLLEVATGRLGWWQLDPWNPESIVVVRQSEEQEQ